MRGSRPNSRRRVATLIGAASVLAATTVASAHDMFLRTERFVVPANSEVVVRLLNGTFSESENSIVRSRVRDASVIGPRTRIPIDMSTWTEDGDTTTFRVNVGGPGTYALGISTTASVIALPGDTFNMYLRDDGIPDILAERRARKELEKPARERYHKHVKALLQVGDSLRRGFDAVFGYPAEIVPLVNPYSLRRGATLRVRVFVDGRPVRNQFILFGGRDVNGGRIEQRSARSGADGTARIPLTAAGDWYIKFIHMARVTSDTVDYESKWATLTFSVRQ
jgi:uncharacterized GH25 family protein